MNLSEVIFKSKLILDSKLVREIFISEVPKDEIYPEGIKFRLVLSDPIWKKVLVLFDNSRYKFTSVERLIEDYLEREKEQEEIYENHEN